MAPPKETKFKVAAAHAAPVFMNKAATIRKTVRLIEQAAEDDVKVLVFPETFIPGYPVGDSPFYSILHFHFFFLRGWLFIAALLAVCCVDDSHQ